MGGGRRSRSSSAAAYREVCRTGTDAAETIGTDRRVLSADSRPSRLVHALGNRRQSEKPSPVRETVRGFLMRRLVDDERRLVDGLVDGERRLVVTE